MKHITITKADINGTEVNSVLLRDLHKSLGLKTEFANWLKDQKEILETYVDGEDYIRTAKDKDGVTLIVKAGLNLRGKQSEYIITLDMAKHLCMLSRTKKGREARQYFINIEKRFNENSNLQLDIQFQRIEALTDFARSTREAIHNHDNRLENLEKNQKIEHWQQKSLTDAKNKIVYSLGGEDQKLIRKLHSRVWSLFKKKFYIPRYVELPSYKYEDGLSFIENMTMGDLL